MIAISLVAFALLLSTGVDSAPSSHYAGELRSYLTAAEGPDGVLDPINLVNQYLHDPMKISDFTVNEHGRLTDFKMSMKHMQLTGLKGLDIDSMKFNLGWMHVETVMKIPRLELRGDYNISGKIMLVPVKGDGPFRMDVLGLTITAKAALNRNHTSDQLQVRDLVLELDVADLDMHFNNLMGSSGLSRFSNGVLNQMSHLIFDHVKISLLDELKQDIQKHLDTQLAQLPHNFIRKRSELLFDDIVQKLGDQMKAFEFDPLKLDDQEESFMEDLGLFKIYGKAEVHNGKLTGLGSLVRTGEVFAVYENDTVTLEAHLGFENLTGSYDWSASLMGAGPAGSSILHVSKLQLLLKLRQGLRRGDKLVLDKFEVEGYKNIWIDLTGLGTLDFVIELIVNLATNGFKGTIARQISGPLRTTLQEQLDKLPYTLFA